MNKICNICQNPLIIQVEYNLKNYSVIIKEGCLHCNFVIKSNKIISKQDIDYHIQQLLDKHICGICNKDVITDCITHCKLGSATFIYIRCLYCETHYIIVKPYNSKEGLDYPKIEGMINIKN